MIVAGASVVIISEIVVGNWEVIGRSVDVIGRSVVKVERSVDVDKVTLSVVVTSCVVLSVISSVVVSSVTPSVVVGVFSVITSVITSTRLKFFLTHRLISGEKTVVPGQENIYPCRELDWKSTVQRMYLVASE